MDDDYSKKYDKKVRYSIILFGVCLISFLISAPFTIALSWELTQTNELAIIMEFIPIFIVLFIISFLSFTLLIALSVALINREKTLKQYTSLTSWVNNVDIGNAYDIVLWLSGQSYIKTPLKEEYNKILKEFATHSLFYYKKKTDYYLPYFVKVIDNLSDTQKNTIMVISSSLNYDTTSSENYKKIWSNIWNISFITGVLVSYKYSIDLFISPKTTEVGLVLLIILSIITVLLILISISKNLKNLKEENAKKFLKLCLELSKIES